MAAKKEVKVASAAGALASVPSFEKVVEAFQLLLAKIEQDIADLESRVGVGNVLFAQVEGIVRRALDEFEWSTLRGLIQSELLTLVLTGRSVVKDDDTDLA
ncbi:MAG: hypothetical protein EBT79_05995 [Actinobacteria bacterium]|nr:hypothetical protein [Actinomycetota bacterium]NBR66821.1 hypothetical protein [Actinomycetota bacterium]